MELSQGTSKTSKFTSENFISNIPDKVVTNILDRLPLQDAVRTSILSRKWRFKWTLLTKLVFDINFLMYLSKRQCRNEYGKIINRFLLHCAITKFYLHIDGEANSGLDDEDISHWIMFLSRNGIEDLTLVKFKEPPLKLHAHLFSCSKLKHLELHNCSFDLPVSFCGFSNLLNLQVSRVNFENGKFGEFITQCPVLEALTLGYGNSTGKVKIVEFAKLTNLKKLNLFDTILIRSASSLFELVGYLPKLEDLSLDFYVCKFKKGGVKKRLSTAFPCLKTLKLTTIDCGIGMNISRVFEMLRNFTDLQTLEISASLAAKDPTPGIGFPEVDYNNTRLLKLRNVVIKHFKDLDGEVRFIKYLLACSPLLEKLVIYPHPDLVYHGKLTSFAMKLLKLHRASPLAEIDLWEP